MDKQTLTFSLERATKNTIRYQEDTDGNPPVVGVLYIQKRLLGEEPPKGLMVIITEIRE
jgi:hypothetical protein